MESNGWGLDGRYLAMMRLDAGDAELVAALDALVAARIHPSREAAALWLARAGMRAHAAVFARARAAIEHAREREAGMDVRSGASGEERDQFEKFTERARKVLSLAYEEAQRFNHNYIGTEHLLLGLVREGDGVAARVLGNLGAELKKVYSAVEFIIGRGDRIVLGELGLTPRTKKVIALAVDEARRLGHRYVGTEHLLLGLIREGEGIAAGVLESVGVNLQRAREQVMRVLAETPAGGSAALTHEETTIMCWLDADEVAALDALVEVGIHPSRDEVATWLIREGLAARRGVLEQIRAKVAEIERLRAEARELARADEPGAGAKGEIGAD